MHHHATLRVLHAGPDAEAAINAAYDLGVSTARRPDIAVFSAAQRLALGLDQGRLGELEGFMAQVAERTQYPMMKAMYAFILWETGQAEAAAGLLRRVGRDGLRPPHEQCCLAAILGR